SARDTASDVQKRQIAHLAGGVAQALGELFAQGKQKVRLALHQFTEARIADFGNFTFDFGAYPCAAVLLVEQAELAEEIPGIEIGDDDLAAIVILDQHGRRTLDDVVEGIAGVAGVDQSASRRVAASAAVEQKLLEPRNVGADGLQCQGILPYWPRRPCDV